MNIITLTTDFGTADWFVGTMKGVIAGIAPKSLVIDLTHEIAPGNIRSGAFALQSSCRFFPKGTIHVTVIDPGVGSARRAIAVKTTDYFFVGPDNGVLSWALRNEKVKAIYLLENEKYFLQPVSRTFHGRDIFAPVAAHLSRGIPLRQLGRGAKHYLPLKWPEPRVTGSGLRGEILFIDRFGNAITNLEAAKIESQLARRSSVVVAKRTIPIAGFYQAVPRGRPVALVGSSGFLEIAINGGNAAESLGLLVGTSVGFGA